MSRWKIAAALAALVLVGLYLLNASWLAPAPEGELRLIAHRGVAQQFGREGLGRQDCAATRIRSPEHPYIENTIPSMRRAFELGAHAVELDVAPTSDNRTAVFHDWTLDCRTDGRGEIRDHRLAELKALDVGYGYTADGGRNFPLRGRGVGMMPTVEEVLRAFRDRHLVFNFKSHDPREADLLLAAFARAGAEVTDRHSFYGHPAIMAAVRQRVPAAWTYSKQQAKACGVDYLLYGWTGIVPESCRDTTIAIPLNYRWIVWGWPNRFLDRMAGANTKVILFGDFVDGNMALIERPEQLAEIPDGYRGYLWVEDMHRIGPALNQ